MVRPAAVFGSVLADGSELSVVLRQADGVFARDKEGVRRQSGGAGEGE